MSNEPTVRGYMLISPMSYIDGSFNEADRAAIVARMPPETRALLGQLRDVDWYPRKHAVHIYTAVAQHHRDHDGTVREGLFKMGASIASRAMETFLRLAMKVMTPEVFARKVPDVWLRDHRGGRLEIDMSDLANNHLAYRLVDVGGYDYVGGVLPGFQTAALMALGCKGLRHECDWTPETPGPETVTCHIRWT